MCAPRKVDLPEFAVVVNISIGVLKALQRGGQWVCQAFEIFVQRLDMLQTFAGIFGLQLPQTAEAMHKISAEGYRECLQTLFDKLTGTESDWLRHAALAVSVVAMSVGEAGDLGERLANVYRECVRRGLVPNLEPLRVAGITTGLGQTYVGGFDLDQFHERIEEAFEWHDGMHKKFLSPSFAMIQSSGMGKTRLMKAYKQAMEKRDRQDYTVLTLLCTKHNVRPRDAQTHYDYILDLPLGSDNCSDGRNRLTKQLDDIVKSAVEKDMKKKLEKQVADKEEKQSGKRGREEEETREVLKLVLLLDEANELTKSHNGGYYVCIRWWLRRSLPWNVRIVAVFVGTSLSLANYQRLAEQQGWSRDANYTFVNFNARFEEAESMKKSYDPFFILTTIGMYQSRSEFPVPNGDALLDIGKCGRHGRPLFATLLDPTEAAGDALKLEEAQCTKEGPVARISSNRLHAILLRLLLSKSPWNQHSLSVASVLGTRVQMGVSSYEFAAEATSSGYAVLVGFEGDAGPTATVVFPPDPVCAALAMGLMKKDWSVGSERTREIKGEEPEFWVKQAFASFERQVFTPSKGDAGEAFAALYMLLCGDELRQQNDPFMRRFEVGLLYWLERLAGKERSVATAGEDRTALAKAKLNFIQVCRNYCRSHSWLETGNLRFMYQSATACYTYMCCPAVDIVFPIKIGENFHPCLVSVKCWEAMTTSEMTEVLEGMKKARDTWKSSIKALCLLIVMGCGTCETTPAATGSFPAADEYRAIVVDGTRDFGINDAIATTFNKQVRAEILASHPYLHTEREMVFRNETLEDDRNFGLHLHAEKSGLPTGGPPPEKRAKGVEE